MPDEISAERKKLFKQIRTHLRKGALDNLQSANYLEDYKYEDSLTNMETSAKHLLAAIEDMKQLIN